MAVEQLLERISTPFMKQTCDNIVKLLCEGKEEDAARLKSSLPVIVLNRLYDNGTPRKKDGGTPTGLIMIDYDDCRNTEEAHELAQKVKAAYLSDITLQEHIIAAHYSPRMHGIHIWYRWFEGAASVDECHQRIAALIQLQNYDQSCKDNSRCSFLVHKDMFFISNWDGMAHNEEWAEVQKKWETNQPTSKKSSARKTIKAAPKANVRDEDACDAPSDAPLEFGGIPIENIVRSLVRKCCPKKCLDADLNVSPGARNNVAFKVSTCLRYVCDNNPDWIMQHMPQWAKDLDHERNGELMNTIVSACSRPVTFSYPKTLQSALRECGMDEEYADAKKEPEQSEEDRQKFAVAEMEGIEASKQKFLMFPTDLPPIFAEWCNSCKAEWKAANAFCLLTLVGTIMSKCRARYLDGRLHSPSFQTVIEAPMASGKQNFSDMSRFILTPITEMDLEGNTKLNLYNAELLKANNSKTVGDPPDVCVRSMNGAFTEAGLNSTLDTAKGLHIVSTSSEIDQVSAVWKSLSYILRLAYDNEMYSRTLQSPRQFRGPRPMFLNTFLCGTPRAVNRVYNDPEDGLVSRTMFFKLVIETQGIPLNRVSERDKERMMKIIRQLHDTYCIRKEDDGYVVALEQQINIDYVNRHLEKWLQRKSDEAAEFGSEAIERFRRRDAVNGFRAGMVAHAIYMATGKRITNKERTVVKKFAEWVAEYSLMMHDFKFGKELNAIIASDQLNESISKMSILDQLPDTFTLSEAYNLFRNEPTSSVRTKLTRLVQKGRLNKEQRGMYTKIIK